MCPAEGADPGAGGGVQGKRGGHGVRTQSSRNGHRRGITAEIRDIGHLVRNSLCHFVSVSASVQESSLELLHHATRDQRVRKSHESRCVPR